MTKTEKTVNGKILSYEILNNGYEIYLGGKLWISQRGQYSKPVDQSLSYEDNCLAQIEELTRQTETVNVDELLKEVSRIE